MLSKCEQIWISYLLAAQQVKVKDLPDKRHTAVHMMHAENASLASLHLNSVLKGLPDHVTHIISSSLLPAGLDPETLGGTADTCHYRPTLSSHLAFYSDSPSASERSRSGG